ncbi:MAG: hypothetical protein QM703_01650 [Gemmatales bacterium]
MGAAYISSSPIGLAFRRQAAAPNVGSGVHGDPEDEGPQVLYLVKLVQVPPALHEGFLGRVVGIFLAAQKVDQGADQLATSFIKVRTKASPMLTPGVAEAGVVAVCNNPRSACMADALISV